MVFLQGAARPFGPAAACLRLAQERRVRLLLSTTILSEIEEVFSRPVTIRRFPVLAELSLPRQLDRWRHLATMIESGEANVRLPSDPKDEKYINLAIAGGADYLVSWDRHLLDLRSEDSPAAQAVRTASPNLRIMTPVEMLSETTALRAG